MVNGDDPWGTQLAERLGQRCWRSSLEPGTEAELRMEQLQVGPDGVRGVLVSPVGSGAFRSPLLGRFNLMNQLQAVGVLLQQGLPLFGLLEGLETFRGVPGRMERVQLEGVEAAQPAVLVDYAHTPDGLESALNACRPFAAGRLICVFGCGGDRDRTKRPLMGGLAARLAEPLELDDFLALAASEGFAIDADDVIAAQQREDERCSDSELQRQAGAEARRLRHFVYG